MAKLIDIPEANYERPKPKEVLEFNHTYRFYPDKHFHGVILPTFSNKQEQNTTKNSDKTQILLLSGKAGSGKNTFGDMLKKELGNKDKKVLMLAYADYLKFICYTYFGWDGKKDKKGRTLLQIKGDEITIVDKNFFVDIVIDLIKVLYSKYDFFIVTDARFKNEILEIKRQFKNVKSIRIVRPNFKTTLTKEQQRHKSEVELDYFNFNHYIENNSLEGLKQTANEFVKFYL